MEARNLLDERLGEGMSTALSGLATTLTRINEQTFKMQPQYPFLVSLGMVMVQCDSEPRYKQPPSSGKKFIDMAVLMRAARYARYAAAAYCTEKEDILKVIQGGEEDFNGNVEVLHVYTSDLAPPKSANKALAPSFFIASDKASGDVVLSIRGRTALPEALADAVAGTSEFMEGSAHEGMAASSKELIEHSKDLLENALKNSAKGTLAIVGHSMGAGVAILATLQAFGGEGSQVEQLLSSGKAKCYAFAPPPVVAPDCKFPAKRASAICSFVNGMDAVPRASLGAVGRLLMAVRQVDELKVEMPTRLDFLRGGETAPALERLSDYDQIPEELGAEFKSLSLNGVGTTVLLFKGEDGKMNCEIAPPELSDRMLLHRNMALDHPMARYEESITEALMQLQRSKGCC